MRLFAIRFAHLALFATLAHYTLACGADTDHGPTIGAPTVPVGPIVEGGGNSSGGIGGQPAATGAQPAPIGTGGGFGSGGSGPFGAAGNGSAGSNPFGSGGSASNSDPFGIGGSPNSANPFGGLGSF